MSIDYTKLSVEEIRAELVKITGCHFQEAEAIKGKANLVERLVEARRARGLEPPEVKFNEVELENKPLIQRDYLDSESDEQEVEAPTMGSPAWEEYVLSHLTDNEVVVKDNKKYPKAHGLRRVAQVLCGQIVASGPVREYISPKMATVVYSVSIMWTKDMKVPQYMSEQELMQLNLPVRTFTEISDCTPDNTPHPYSLHAPSTASSKAQGRVFKSILQLSCHTAEEMSLALQSPTDDVKTTEVSVANIENEKISGVQRRTIDSLANRLSINLEKALEFHSLPSDVNALTRAEASNFMTILNKYQTDVAGASMEIPDIIKN